jgi:pimeloyl-ACP methyl ester carboxylesterase
MTAYFIPGLGTDYRIFQKIVPLLSFEEVVYLDFRDDLIRKGEGMADYAKRLLEELKPKENEKTVIIGLSLGGMMACELAKLIPNSKLILISTIKTKKESPAIFAFARKFPIYNFVPTWFSRNMVPIISRIARVTDKAGYHLYRAMLKGWSAKKLLWARHAAVNWKNTELPARFMHIHGTRDHIFPHKRISGFKVIEGGSHYMVMDRAEEIAEIINDELTIME